jgi:hypothetical protein
MLWACGEPVRVGVGDEEIDPEEQSARRLKLH